MKSVQLALALFFSCMTVVAHCDAAQAVNNEPNNSFNSVTGAGAKSAYLVRFTLTCGNGACADVYYTVCYPSGVAAIGDTDPQGRTAYYETEDPEALKLFLGHHVPGDCGDHGPLGIQVTREVQAR